MRKALPIALLASAMAAPTAAQTGRPNLIVTIAVDQLSSDLFEEYRPHFTGGLKRIAGGVAFARGFQAHGVTETCPGHASILTGAYPARTGIVANQWFDADAPRADKYVNCVEDERVPESSSKSYAVSDLHLKVPTLGDRMKAADPRTRVVSVAGKDRSAVLLGGRNPDQSWWWTGAGFVPKQGTAPSPVAARLNAAVTAAIAKPRPPLPVPAYCAAKDAAVALAPGLSVGTHRFQRSAGDSTAFTESPESDAATLALAAALAQELRLGRNGGTDLLAIGLSATDHVGHDYGTKGLEMCLQLTTLDSDLGNFLDVLDRSGVSYAVVLTADHGGADVPERSGGVRVDQGARPAAIGAAVAERRGLAGPIFTSDWHVAPSVPAARRAEMLAAAKQLLSAHPQVESVHLAAEVAATPLSSGPPAGWTMLERFRASYDEERSPDIFISYKENVTVIPVPRPGYAATHGTPWDHDRKVPILFWWPGITPQARGEGPATVDIMPTLASLIGLTVPAAEIDGRCLDLVDGAGTNCR